MGVGSWSVFESDLDLWVKSWKWDREKVKKAQVKYWIVKSLTQSKVLKVSEIRKSAGRYLEKCDLDHQKVRYDLDEKSLLVLKSDTEIVKKCCRNRDLWKCYRIFEKVDLWKVNHDLKKFPDKNQVKTLHFNHHTPLYSLEINNQTFWLDLTKTTQNTHLITNTIVPYTRDQIF